MRTGNFNKNTITTLYKRAGEHCSLCKRITTKPHSNPEKFHNLGEAAHIQGIKDAPNLRFNAKLSIIQLKNVKNGIWLCQACHHIIDNDEKTYTVRKLNAIKSLHENLIVKIQESGESLMPMLNNKDREIKRYQKMISEMEAEIDEKDVLYSEELNRTKFVLSTLRTEHTFLNEQLTKIKTEIIDLDNEVLQKALLEEKDIAKALEILDEDKLDHSEMKLAKSRVLRARLLISTGDMLGAEQNFERAFQIYPRFFVAIEYVQLLYYKKLDYRRIIEICESALNKETKSSEQVILMEQIAQAQLKLGKPDLAFEKLNAAKIVLENNEEATPKLLSRLANIEKHIGDCFKLMGNLQKSLKSYELALNIYFRSISIDQEFTSEKELAGLGTAIGLIYEANNNPTEGLIHHLRAFDVLENIAGADKEKAIILLNLATCYMSKRNFDPKKAIKYAFESITILTKLSKIEPNEFLEYLVGAKCLYADISFVLKSGEAEIFYAESLKLAKILYAQNHIFLHALSHVQYNYSIFLIISKQEIEKGVEILEDSIAKIRASQVAIFEYVSYLSQALLFKAEITKDLQIKKKLLQEVLSLTVNLEPTDKNNIWKIKAQVFLSHLEDKL